MLSRRTLLIQGEYALDSCVEIEPRSAVFGAQAPGLGDTPYAQSVEARHEAWAQRLPKAPEELWEVLVGFDADSRAALFAHCVALTVNAVHDPWGADDDIIARLVKKTLVVGVFAFLIGNWNDLACIVLDSFAGLGLLATGGTIGAGELLQPGRIAQVGLEAGRPLLDAIAGLMGFVAFFENFVQIAILMFGWAAVLLAFFILAIQLFVTLIEFKLARASRRHHGSAPLAARASG